MVLSSVLSAIFAVNSGVMKDVEPAELTNTIRAKAKASIKIIEIFCACLSFFQNCPILLKNSFICPFITPP